MPCWTTCLEKAMSKNFIDFNGGRERMERIVKEQGGDPLLLITCNIVYAMAWGDGAFIARGAKSEESDFSVRDLEAAINKEKQNV